MTDSRYWPKDVIKQFIALYRSCPALWKVDSKVYRSQYLKNCAYDKLIKFCREKVTSEANKDFVAKRIQGLRGSFRKEAKRTKTLGRKPTLWYYDLMLFTKEQDDKESQQDVLDVSKFILSAQDIANIKQEPDTSEDAAIRFDTRYWSKDFMIKFIEIYKSFPCLWKISSDEYKSKQLKTQAYEQMVTFVRDNIYPVADRDFVIKKIQSLRGVFRKHYKKVIESKRTASSEEDVYKSDLWYYDLLLFLKDDVEPGESNCETFAERNLQCASESKDIQTSQIPLDPKTYTKNLIKMYESFPCLWKVASPDYTNKSVKESAIQKMITYSQKIYSHADREFVIKKIQSLRAAFRKEHKKLITSRVNATCDADIYKSNLWYYDLLMFVEEEHKTDELEEPTEDGIEIEQINNIDYEEIIEIKEEHIISDEENQEIPCYTVPDQKGVKRKIEIEEHDFEFSASSSCDVPSNNPDLNNEYEAVGINVSKKLQRMDPTQAIYAEALIVKLLSMGLLKKLDSDTDIFQKTSCQ